MILATAHFHVLPELGDDFVEAARTVISATTSEEPGCLGYACYRDVSDDLRFVFVEEWQDMGAISGHVRTAHYQQFKELADRTVREQEVTLHTVERSRTV